MPRYRYGTDIVLTDLALPLPGADGEGEDVTVVRTAGLPSDVPVEWDEVVTDGAMHGERWAFGRERGRDDWTFVHGTVCRASVSASGGDVTVEVAPGIPEDWIADLVVGWLLVYRLVVIGKWAFHGSAAVGPDGRAIAFVGPSGSGKSTLATAASEHGYRLLADDSLVGEASDDQGVEVWRTAADVKLRGAAGALVTDATQPRRRTFDDRTAVTLRPGPASAPLDRLVVLAGKADAWSVRPLGPPEVVAALLRNSKVGLWTSAERRDAEFDAAVHIAQTVTAVELRSPDLRTPEEHLDLFVRTVEAFG